MSFKVWKPKLLKELKFDNIALRALPVDSTKLPGSRKVSSCYSLINLSPVENPRLVALSPSAMKLLDLDATSAPEKEFALYFGGNEALPGSEPAAHCYCGHQFGYFSGQLGDGTVAYLGEVVNNSNERWEIQLKGAGHTPFSRGSDGRKVLRSSIREFLCSEAMHHLGIATTRAGTLVDSDSKVTRDMFYDGRARRENCALVLRIAPTFLRFGSFEIFKPTDDFTGKAGPCVGKTQLLVQMLDHTIGHYFPDIADADFETNIDRYLSFYEQVCLRTAETVAKWQCVGFCHGVLNTDNMSILGLTIDYGPFGFLDTYDPDFVCNTTDENGRYAFRKQPEICRWNLERLAEAIQDAVPLARTMEIVGRVYGPEFNRVYLREMRKKLGLFAKQEANDLELVDKMLCTMKETFADYTIAFRSLSELDLPGSPNHGASRSSVIDRLTNGCRSLGDVKDMSRPSFAPERLEALKRAMRDNPALLTLFGGGSGPLKQEIEKSERFERLQNITEEDYKSSIAQKWSDWLDLYSQRLELECQGESELDSVNAERKQAMNRSNPKYILRNYVAQNAIAEAEKGNYLEVRNILRRLENPFDEEMEQTAGQSPEFGFANILYDAPPPASACGLQLS